MDTPELGVTVVWVTWQGRSTVRVPQGSTLLEGLLAAGLRAPHQCRQARCARCRVTVSAGWTLLSDPEERERGRLGPKAPARTRLMCQARIRSDASASDTIVLNG